jgi:hypothetical protein
MDFLSHTPATDPFDAAVNKTGPDHCAHKLTRDPGILGL